MKVKFECEKCGKVLNEYEPVVDAFYIFQRESSWPCPACAKLTYGPLTEEMVAEALATANRDDTRVAMEEYAAEARFVLRLLEAGIPDDDYYRYVVRSPEWWRDWLLDLAMKP